MSKKVRHALMKVKSGKENGEWMSGALKKEKAKTVNPDWSPA